MNAYLIFAKENWLLFAGGLLSILLGYICLSIPPVDGILSLTIAPVLLVLGYCVLIPLSLLRGISGTRNMDGDSTD